MQRRRFVLSASALALAIVLPLPRALAQGCAGDDGFAAVPCCSPANPTIPAFPSFTLTGDYACIKDCSLEAQFRVNVVIGHVPVLCDYRVIPLTVTPASAGAPGWTAVLLAKYSRTWLEMDATGTINRQVWRFLVNADLTPTAGAQPCPIPADPLGLRVQFHGHLDYACDNTPPAPTFSAALSLHHLPGCIEHNTFACLALPAPFDHPERSFHLIAPGGFSFTPVAEPQGATPADAVRSTLFPSPIVCLGEGQVTTGNILTTLKNCLCMPPPATGPFLWCHQTISGASQCIGMLGPYTGLPVALPLPPLPTGFATLPLGRWTGATGTFPGQRELFIHWGILSYSDACNPADFPVQIVQGVSTSRSPGRVFNSAITTVFNTFMDFQDMLRQSTSTGLFVPSWGCIFFSKRVWNLNIP